VLGTGIAGLAMAFFANRAGASQVIVFGRREERLAKARIVGADAALLSNWESVTVVKDLSKGGVDLALEAAGSSEALQLGMACLRKGGTAAIYGLSEGYIYNLPMLSAPLDFHLHVPNPEEHLAYHWVCRQISSGIVPVWQFISHEWSSPDLGPGAFAEVERGQVLKGFVRFS
jgi:threonine dehydrogenase-like Zn-dependent dehydrogenase